MPHRIKNCRSCSQLLRSDERHVPLWREFIASWSNKKWMSSSNIHFYQLSSPWKMLTLLKQWPIQCFKNRQWNLPNYYYYALCAVVKDDFSPKSTREMISFHRITHFSCSHWLRRLPTDKYLILNTAQRKQITDFVRFDTMSTAIHRRPTINIIHTVSKSIIHFFPLFNSSALISGLSSIWWRWEIRMPPTISIALDRCTLWLGTNDGEEKEECSKCVRTGPQTTNSSNGSAHCVGDNISLIAERWWITKCKINDPAMEIRLSRNFSLLSVVVCLRCTCSSSTVSNTPLMPGYTSTHHINSQLFVCAVCARELCKYVFLSLFIL